MARPKGGRTCSNDWCDRPHCARGYCRTCYLRFWKSGDTARASTVHRQWEVRRAEVDEAVVDGLLAGVPPRRATVGEREEALRRLHVLGLNDREIGSRLRIPKASVWRIRQRLSLPANHLGWAHWELGRDDVDEMVVLRLVTCDPPARTTLGEREEAVRRLHGLGLNDYEIARRTRMPQPSIGGIRRRLGLPCNQRGHARSGQLYFTDHLARNRIKAIRAATP